MQNYTALRLHFWSFFLHRHNALDSIKYTKQLPCFESEIEKRAINSFGLPCDHLVISVVGGKKEEKRKKEKEKNQKQ